MQHVQPQRQDIKYQDVLFIQFARAPVAGQVKTRLIPALGAHGACQLHCVLVTQVLNQLLATQLATTVLYSDDPHATALRQVCEPVFARHGQQAMLFAQRGAQLGERMANAISDQLEAADSLIEKVILVGSDCVGLDRDYLWQAIAALDKGSDVVLGPAEDGGYVLIGMSRFYPALFEGIDWGSDQVLAQSLAVVEREGLSATQLAVRADIDRAEDLSILSEYGIDISSLN